MTLTDTTVPTQSESISFELALHHAPDKVWRALTDPALRKPPELAQTD